MICHWAINRTDPQNLLSTTLDVLLQMILVKIQNYETLGMHLLLLQTTHNALSVIDMTIFSTNILIMSAKDIIEKTLVTTKSSASFNHDNPNHDSL